MCLHKRYKRLTGKYILKTGVRSVTFFPKNSDYNCNLYYITYNWNLHYLHTPLSNLQEGFQDFGSKKYWWSLDFFWIFFGFFWISSGGIAFKVGFKILDVAWYYTGLIFLQTSFIYFLVLFKSLLSFEKSSSNLHNLVGLFISFNFSVGT